MAGVGAAADLGEANERRPPRGPASPGLHGRRCLQGLQAPAAKEHISREVEQAARGVRLPTGIEARDLSGSQPSHPPDPAREGQFSHGATREPSGSSLPPQSARGRGLLQGSGEVSSIFFALFFFTANRWVRRISVAEFLTSARFFFIGRPRFWEFIIDVGDSELFLSNALI